jgi:hypothetical protein
MPSDQKASQIRSAFAFSSPVITASKRIEERVGRRDQRTIHRYQAFGRFCIAPRSFPDELWQIPMYLPELLGLQSRR